MTRIGLCLPTWGAFPRGAREELAAIADLAEASGVARLWVHDRLAVTAEELWAAGGESGDQMPYDAWSILAMLAARTSRIGLGSAVTPIMLRRLVPFAQTAATIDELSGGRVVVGVGAGWHAEEFEEAGIPFRPHAERVEQLREGALLLENLLDGQIVWWEGDHYALRGARIRPPREDGRTPVWIGGGSQELIEVAADIGDGWIAPPDVAPDELEAQREQLTAVLAESVRPEQEIPVAVPLFCLVAKTTKRAREEVDAYLTEGPLPEEEAERIRENGIWGSAETCARKLEPYLELADEVILDLRDPRRAARSAERICRDLIGLVGRAVE